MTDHYPIQAPKSGSRIIRRLIRSHDLTIHMDRYNRAVIRHMWAAWA